MTEERRSGGGKEIRRGEKGDVREERQCEDEMRGAEEE